MEKHVKYCPYCKKYQPSTFYDCAFCLRKLWLLKDWEETEDEEKEDWLKYPMPAKDISGIGSGKTSLHPKMSCLRFARLT